MLRSTILIFTTLVAGAAAASGQGLFLSGRSSLSSSRQLSGSATVAVAAPKPADTSATAISSDLALEHKVFDLINKTRAENGDQPLVWSDEAAAIAREHSVDMAVNNRFSHRGTDGSMVDDRATNAGITNWQAISENIAFVSRVNNPAEFAIEKWMESTAHHDNLLDKRWKESAVGAAVRSDGTIYFTQVFILRF